MKNITNRPSFLFDEDDNKSSSSNSINNLDSLSLEINFNNNPTDNEIIEQINKVKNNFSNMTKKQVIDAIPEEVKNIISKGGIMAGQSVSDDEFYKYMQNYINNLSLDTVKEVLQNKMTINNNSTSEEDLMSELSDAIQNAVGDIVNTLTENFDEKVAELEEMPWNEAFNNDFSVNMLRTKSLRVYGDDGNTGKSLLGKNARFYKDVPRHTELIYVAIYDIGSYDTSATTNDIKIQLRDEDNNIITPANSDDIIKKDLKTWITKWNIPFETESKTFLLQASEEKLLHQYNDDPISDLGNNYGAIVYDTMNESMINQLSKNKDEISKLIDSPDSEELISMVNNYDEEKDDPEEFNRKLNELDIDEDLRIKFKKEIRKSDLVKDIIQSTNTINGSKSSIRYTVMDDINTDNHPAADINLLTNNKIYSSIEVAKTENIKELFIKDFNITDKDKFNYKMIEESKLISNHYGPIFDMSKFDKGFIEDDIVNTDKFVLCFFNNIDSTRTGLYIAYAKSPSNQWIEYIPEFYNGFNPNTLETFSILENPEYFDEYNILKGQDNSNVRLSPDFAFWYKEQGVFKLGDLGKLRILMDNKMNLKDYFYLGKLYLNDSDISNIFKQDHNVDPVDNNINIYIKCPENIDSDTYGNYFLSTLMHLAMDINSKDVIKNSILKFNGPICYINLHLDDYADFLIND